MNQKKQLKPKLNPESKDACADNGEDVKEAMLLAALNEKKPSNVREKEPTKSVRE